MTPPPVVPHCGALRVCAPIPSARLGVPVTVTPVLNPTPTRIGSPRPYTLSVLAYDSPPSVADRKNALVT